MSLMCQQMRRSKMRVRHRRPAAVCSCPATSARGVQVGACHSNTPVPWRSQRTHPLPTSQQAGNDERDAGARTSRCRCGRQANLDRRTLPAPGCADCGGFPVLDVGDDFAAGTIMRHAQVGGEEVARSSRKNEVFFSALASCGIEGGQRFPVPRRRTP